MTVKEFFVVAPTFQPVNFTITNLMGDSVALRNAIAASVAKMLRQRAKPAYALNGVPPAGHHDPGGLGVRGDLFGDRRGLLRSHDGRRHHGEQRQSGDPRHDHVSHGR